MPWDVLSATRLRAVRAFDLSTSMAVRVVFRSDGREALLWGGQGQTRINMFLSEQSAKGEAAG